VLQSEFSRDKYEKDLYPKPFELNSDLRIPLKNTVLSERAKRQRESYKPPLSSLVCCSIKSVCAANQMRMVDSFGAIQA
jgi:hypothetical protein